MAGTGCTIDSAPAHGSVDIDPPCCRRSAMPTLVPVEEPYTEEQVEGFIASLQTRGYCVLPDVWERESVSAYERRIRAGGAGGALHGARAAHL